MFAALHSLCCVHSWQCKLFLTGNVRCSPHHIYGEVSSVGLHDKPTLTPKSLVLASMLYVQKWRNHLPYNGDVYSQLVGKLLHHCNLNHVFHRVRKEKVIKKLLNRYVLYLLYWPTIVYQFILSLLMMMTLQLTAGGNRLTAFLIFQFTFAKQCISIL